ncbi:hypothetical protein diail_8244 [Diaporthe ilicicola]|nr:hypothetical protein diail_8244 [Diaporthe ilicicola]
MAAHNSFTARLSLKRHIGLGEFQLDQHVNVLLPCYPELSAQFTQDERFGNIVNALDLFVNHFLRESSVFETFGLEHLYESQILTGPHLHDIQEQSRYGSIADDLDRLDEIVSEIDEASDLNENAIAERNSMAVDELLAIVTDTTDDEMLCHAVGHYEWAVLHHLLEHGAEVHPMGFRFHDGPLHLAANSGHLGAVQQLLDHGANIEGGGSYSSTTPMEGATSGGHLEIAQYLVENGANVNGNRQRFFLVE